MSYTEEDVKSHNSSSDLWIIVDSGVYDLTSFQKKHPGGAKILQRVAGKDASQQFWKYHNEAILKKYEGLKVGQVGQVNDKPLKDVVPATQNQVNESVPSEERTFGELLPFCDPAWYQGYYSPYYNETHHAFRRELREFMDSEVIPNLEQWEEDGNVPDSLLPILGKRGYLAATYSQRYLSEFCDYKIKSVPPEKYDAFHSLILGDEISRAGSGGLGWALLGGLRIGLPPIIHFMKNEKIRNEVAKKCLNGEARICLAITEPDAGSDVANLTTKAIKTEDGKYYIVNGSKKWITNGIFSDYFTVAVRTGGEGMKGISLLLIEKNMEGVELRRMSCTGGYISGTTYIELNDVKVPVENLIGEENMGFKCIMSNFNEERISIAIQSIRFARVCFSEAIKYALKRRTFNKKLIEHDVITYKLANMARQIESTQAWVEYLIYQTTKLEPEEASLRLGGAIASLKAQAGIVFEYCSSNSIQIFGGLGYTKGGQGGVVERLWRDVKAYTIPGGSEEIMLLLSMRQSLRVSKAMGAKI